MPDSGFVFACFNSTHKIAPGTFKVWMRLLDRIPSSVLWLYRQGDDREGHIAAQNLRREAERHGVAADRLMFAPFAPMISKPIDTFGVTLALPLKMKRLEEFVLSRP